MEHVYSAYTKIVQDQLHYFVKKTMVIPELVGIADIVVGFGMHTDFEKACLIAGINDPAERMKLQAGLEQSVITVQAPAVVKQEKVRTKITDPVTHWLADRAVAVLN